MDQRDQELLDKQLRYLSQPSRNDGITIFMLVAIFFSGLVVGGILFGHRAETTQVASNEPTGAISAPY